MVIKNGSFSASKSAVSICMLFLPYVRSSPSNHSIKYRGVRFSADKFGNSSLISDLSKDSVGNPDNASSSWWKIPER